MAGDLIKNIAQSWRPYAAACVFGIVLALAFPPFPMGFIAYAGLLPFLYWMRIEKSSEAFKTGYWWGFGFHTAGVYWILVSTILGGVAVLLFLPLFSAVTLLIFRWFYRKFGKFALAIFPFLWTSVEYIRTVSVYAFCWMSIGYSQTYYAPLLQYAEYSGVHGVVFWICVVNIIVFLIVERIRKARLSGNSPVEIRTISLIGILLALFIIPLIHGLWVMGADKYRNDSITVSLVQGHVDMESKEDPNYKDNNFELYESLTLEAAESQPDLIVWPETATLSSIRISLKYNRWLRSIVRNSNTPLLTGTHDIEIHENGDYTYYNSALLLNNEADRGQWYAKVRLVPFGEWFPYEDRFPMFQMIDFGQANFKPGKEYTVMSLERKIRNADSAGISETAKDSVLFSIGICFESIFPEIIRTFCRNGSQLLVVISNVEWFGKTSSLFQHARIGVLRAIENRIGVAHCSNSGISVIIDPYGRILHQSGVFVRQVLTGRAYLFDKHAERTFFTRNGELLAKMSLFICFILFVAGQFIKKSEIHENQM